MSRLSGNDRAQSSRYANRILFSESGIPRRCSILDHGLSNFQSNKPSITDAFATILRNYVTGYDLNYPAYSFSAAATIRFS